MSCCVHVCTCVCTGTCWGGQSQGPRCLHTQRSAECTKGRISEIKECDKDRRKRRRMTERGYRAGNNNKKRKVSAGSPLLSTMKGSLAIKYVSNALREGKKRRGEGGATKLQMS